MKLFLIIMIFFHILFQMHCIDLNKLESFGINKNTFYVNDILIYFNRAFLAIPRSTCQNNISHPTLVELPWKDNVILKSRMQLPIEGQMWADCKELQNAVSLAKEGVKSKLWILDQGNQFCPAKVMMYSMLHNRFIENELIDLAEVDRNRLNSLVVENGTKIGDHRAFIGSVGENELLVCYLKNLKCVRAQLLQNSLQTSLKPINGDFLTINKGDSVMFFTSKDSLEVYSLDIQAIPEELQAEPSDNLTILVKYRGNKLGMSSGLMVDSQNGLLYYLTRDNVIVRWNTAKPLQAEYHDVLLQSSTLLPYVSRLFPDLQGNIFALVNMWDPDNCLANEEQGNETLERTLRIVKYNWMLDKYLIE
ncbi:hypothetical protein ABEB36_009041 [Hypothenemus hampei]|uniref:Bee-milk protein n=1 Tax=Hypothenemus hampei TaxID=57062 RepID=A0ABD1ENX6_HYPHA